MSITHLDYPGAKLSIEANTPIEQQYRARACWKEPFTVRFIEDCPPGSVLWDIGANTGPYSLIGAHRGLFVVAVEPGFNNYAALCRNLAMNAQLDKVLTVCGALGDASGWTWLHYGDLRSGAASHVLGGVRKQSFHKQLVPVWTWDDLAARLPLPEQPQYAKIDVDGNELAVLKGGSQTLARVQGLIVEMQAPAEAEIVAELGRLGFKLAGRYDQRDGKPIGPLAYGRFERA